LSVTRPFDSSSALYYKRSIVTMHPSGTVVEIWHLEDNGVMILIFWGHVTSSVTWPSTRGGRLPMGGPLWPCVHLAPMWKYVASNIGCTDVNTKRKTKEGKKKECVS